MRNLLRRTDDAELANQIRAELRVALQTVRADIRELYAKQTYKLDARAIHEYLNSEDGLATISRGVQLALGDLYARSNAYAMRDVVDAELDAQDMVADALFPYYELSESFTLYGDDVPDADETFVSEPVDDAERA